MRLTCTLLAVAVGSGFVSQFARAGTIDILCQDGRFSLVVVPLAGESCAVGARVTLNGAVGPNQNFSVNTQQTIPLQLFRSTDIAGIIADVDCNNTLNGTQTSDAEENLTSNGCGSNLAPEAGAPAPSAEGVVLPSALQPISTSINCANGRFTVFSNPSGNNQFGTSCTNQVTTTVNGVTNAQQFNVPTGNLINQQSIPLPAGAVATAQATFTCTSSVSGQSVQANSNVPSTTTGCNLAQNVNIENAAVSANIVAPVQTNNVAEAEQQFREFNQNRFQICEQFGRDSQVCENAREQVRAARVILDNARGVANTATLEVAPANETVARLEQQVRQNCQSLNDNSPTCQQARTNLQSVAGRRTVSGEAPEALSAAQQLQNLENQAARELQAANLQLQNLSNQAAIELSNANNLNEAEARACNPPTGNPTSAACQAAREASEAARNGQ